MRIVRINSKSSLICYWYSLVISTAGIYFMYNEACFALVAICLPTLSGALKLRGVQRLVGGFSTIFSNMSQRFCKSNKSARSRKTHGRLGSSHSQALALTPANGYLSNNYAEGNSNIEMGYVISNDGITVTSTFEQESLKKWMRPSFIDLQVKGISMLVCFPHW